MTRWIMVGLSCFLSLGGRAAQLPTKTQVRLVLSVEGARPGESILAGIQLRMPPGWHTYWKNPGDSGQATRIDWILTNGISAGETQWPVPEKFVTTAGPVTFVTYVYHEEALLVVPLKLDAQLPEGTYEIRAKLSWQECERQCFPGKGEVKASLVVGKSSSPSRESAMFEAWRTKLPKTEPQRAEAAWEKPGQGEDRPLLIKWNTAVRPADFFPYDKAVQGGTEVVAGEPFHFRKIVKSDVGKWPAEIRGLLVERPGTPQAIGYEVTLPIAEGAAKGMAPSVLTRGGTSLLAMLGLALLGGIILNIMPCVLPVLALKVLGFVNQAREAPARVRKLGLVYGLGVLVSFLVLAGIAIGVQRAGSLAGWGMAFQNPQFRVIITIILFLVALNLFGVFEINLGGGAMSAATELTAKQGIAGAFLNGVLATILATPCTAPFLGTAVGFAFTQPPQIILLIFAFVALGLALPFVLLCWHPAWLRFLPKPGLWMQRFKVAMGFPMMATAVWLFWVTATRLGRTGVLWFGLFLVLVSLAAWIWGEFVQKNSRRKALAIVICVLVVGLAYGGILEQELHWRSSGKSAGADEIIWKPWSPEAVAAARAEGRPVFVDFTADTCLNCKYFEATSINIPATRSRLKELNVATLVADYTDENPQIAQELRKYGSGGVPMYLIYSRDPAAAPLVLTSLTPKSLLDALDQAGRESK